MTRPPDDVVARAEAFVRQEAGFAQVTTLDAHGYPVSRSMTAFLADGFVVELVQRRVHRRLAQLGADPRLLTTWVGPPAPSATNERPHVFDLGRLPDRTVMVRGAAEVMDDDWTWEVYARHHADHLARGNYRAPSRDGRRSPPTSSASGSCPTASGSRASARAPSPSTGPSGGPSTGPQPHPHHHEHHKERHERQDHPRLRDPARGQPRGV